MAQIISAAVTPFYENGKIDIESACRAWNFQIERGVDGIFVFGTMGEWALLLDEEIDRLAMAASDLCRGRARLLFGVSDKGLPSMLRNMERLSHLDHANWCIILPGGWPGPADVVKYTHSIADASDRPIMLYHAPAFNGINITPAQFRDIFSHPKIAGLKNSAGTMRLRKELLLIKKDLDVEIFDGEEWDIDLSIQAGCDGVVAGFGSVGAKLMRRIVDSVESGDFPSASEYQNKLIDIFHRVYGANISYWNVGQKYALQYMGLISSHYSRIDGQQSLPEVAQEQIRLCIDEYRDLLF